MDTARIPTADDFEGIHNFRDFGGQPAEGGRVRPGRLFRSANFAEATDADLQRIATMRLGAIVDLRRPAERARYPTRRHPDCPAVAVTYGAPSDQIEPPHLSFMTEAGVTPAVVIERMTAIYRDFAFLPGHIQIFADAFRVLAEVDAPVIMHCHAGKDRTGLLCGLVLHTLGVPEEAVFHDYLRTNSESRIEQRLPQLAQLFEEASGRAPDPDVLRAVLGVERSYLEAAYEAIEREYGSLDGYVNDALGVTPAQRERLRDKLIV